MTSLAVFIDSNLSLMMAGAPHPNLNKGMEDEHCYAAGNDMKFVTDNNGITTTPAEEYNITLGRTTCPEENMLNKQGKKIRKIQRIKELKALPLATKAKLVEEEIIAVVIALRPRHANEPSHAQPWQ
jgi:hypothetical protein